MNSCLILKKLVMKQIINRGSFLTLMFMLLGCLSLYAADNDLITKQITIKLEKAGTLPDKIGSSKKYKITNLKIIGEINGTDLKMIREMAGRDYIGYFTDGKLSVLDLSEAKIVEGGDFYYYINNHYNYYYYYTSNDVIGSYAFKGCNRLTSLTLPDGITSIGYYAFYDCRGLTSLTLPVGITEIGDRAFDGCSGLKEVRFCINDNLDTYLTKGHPYIDVDCGIKYYINDKEITSIEIPSNVTTLGNYVFQGCSGLTSLTLPAGITEIGSSAFNGCSRLTSIYLNAEKVPEIGSNVFEGCDAKKCTLYVPMGTYDDYRLSDFGDYFENIVGFDVTGSYKITINLEKAGTLPDKIASSKKYQITNLKIIGEINGTDLRMIRDMAGSNSTDGKLSVLDLSEAKIVEGGGSYIYYYHYYYTSNDVIGDYAFDGCSGLTSLNLPAGITSIGSRAFQGCSGLTSIYVYAEKVPKIDINVFVGVGAKKCTLYVPMGNRDDY